MRRTLDLVDVFRIDHFRGFAGYWAVPAAAETARDGHWEPGPGAASSGPPRRALGELPVIAEDLGLITPDVDELRDELGFPGMAVMLWAFDGPPDNPHRLENHRVSRSSTPRRTTPTRSRATSPESRRGPFSSWRSRLRAALAMVPAQDVLELGSEARMNRPGELGGNWDWRLEPGQLGPDAAVRLRAAAERAARA